MHPPNPPNTALLQSRLPAWRAAGLGFLALSTCFTSTIFAHAHEHLGVVNHGLGLLPQAEAENSNMEGHDGYAPDFAYLDRSIIGRQTPMIIPLTINQKASSQIGPGETLYFKISQGQSSSRRSGRSPLDVMGEDDIHEESNQSSVDEDTARLEDAATNAATDDETSDLRKRQSGSTVFVSATTCRQPMPAGNGSSTPDGQVQLILYVSNSTQNQLPGPHQDSSSSIPFPFDSGYAAIEMPGGSDIYLGIGGPNLTNGWFGSWGFEIAASTDDFYHQYNDSDTFLYIVDTDNESALFVTPDISTSNDSNTMEQLQTQNPFKMYAFAVSTWNPISGIEHSYCALKSQLNSTSTSSSNSSSSSNSTSNSNTLTITTNVTTKFVDTLPKSQYFVQGLEAGQTYRGFIVVDQTNTTANLPGVGAVGSGGLVFQSFNWTTKADDSCQILYGLNFCSSIAYAVPSSPQFKDNIDGLRNLYDQQAQAYYQFFSQSLAQIACDAVPESQYSLAVNCSLCDRYYKDWLCSVLIPRCESFSATDDFLQPRNINAPFPNGTLTYNGNVTQDFNNTMRLRPAFNQSRNPMIDQSIQPGPYKELKPCMYLCNDIVRACPAQLQFSCPTLPNTDYESKGPNDDVLQCNFPGAVVKLNFQAAAGRSSVGLSNMAFVAIMIVVSILL